MAALHYWLEKRSGFNLLRGRSSAHHFGLSRIVCHTRRPSWQRFTLGATPSHLRLFRSAFMPRGATRRTMFLKCAIAASAKQTASIALLLLSPPHIQHVSQTVHSIFLCQGRGFSHATCWRLKPEKLQFELADQPPVLVRG